MVWRILFFTMLMMVNGCHSASHPSPPSNSSSSSSNSTTAEQNNDNSGKNSVPTGDTASTQGSGTVNEPVMVGGAFLACLADNIPSANEADLYCSLRNPKDQTVVQLPTDVSLQNVELESTANNQPLDWSVSPDTKWQWMFSNAKNFTKYSQLKIHLVSSVDTVWSQDYTTPISNIATAVVVPTAGTAVTYLPWYPGEPNNYKGPENCGAIYNYYFKDATLPNPTFGWDDNSCTNGPYHFACQNKNNSLDWVLSQDAGLWTAFAGKCQDPYIFSVPMNAAQSSALIAAANKFFATSSTASTAFWLNFFRPTAYVDTFVYGPGAPP